MLDTALVTILGVVAVVSVSVGDGDVATVRASSGCNRMGRGLCCGAVG